MTRPPAGKHLFQLRYCAFQIIRRFADPCGGSFNDLRNLWNLPVRFFPLFRVHIFADRRDRLRSVTRVGTRRVNVVLEPGTRWKPLFIQEQAGNLEKSGGPALLPGVGRIARASLQ